jgi:ERCC4-related helicase
LATRGYQQEMLEESLQRNIVIALDTGSGKTHIAVLRMKHECERQQDKVRFVHTLSLADQTVQIVFSCHGSLPQPFRCVDNNV